jgi:hypothetical protein
MGLGGVLVALSALGSGLTGAPQRRDQTEIAALPAAVREALDRAATVYTEPLNGARWSKAYCLDGSNHPIYQVQGTNKDGRKIEIEITRAGRIIEVEEHGIPMKRVPSAVRDALRAKMPTFEPSVIEAIYQSDRNVPVSYGFEGHDENGEKIEVYLSADGKQFLN